MHTRFSAVNGQPEVLLHTYVYRQRIQTTHIVCIRIQTTHIVCIRIGVYTCIHTRFSAINGQPDILCACVYTHARMHTYTHKHTRICIGAYVCMHTCPGSLMIPLLIRCRSKKAWPPCSLAARPRWHASSSQTGETLVLRRERCPSSPSQPPPPTTAPKSTLTHKTQTSCYPSTLNPF